MTNKELASKIIALVGGEENISVLTHCATRPCGPRWAPLRLRRKTHWSQPVSLLSECLSLRNYRNTLQMYNIFSKTTLVATDTIFFLLCRDLCRGTDAFYKKSWQTADRGLISARKGGVLFRRGAVFSRRNAALFWPFQTSMIINGLWKARKSAKNFDKFAPPGLRWPPHFRRAAFSLLSPALSILKQLERRKCYAFFEIMCIKMTEIKFFLYIFVAVIMN